MSLWSSSSRQLWMATFVALFSFVSSPTSIRSCVAGFSALTSSIPSIIFDLHFIPSRLSPYTYQGSRVPYRQGTTEQPQRSWPLTQMGVVAFHDHGGTRSACFKTLSLTTRVGIRIGSQIIGANQKRNHTFSPHSDSQKDLNTKNYGLPPLKTFPQLTIHPFCLLCFFPHRFAHSHHCWLRKTVDDTLCASDIWGNLHGAYVMFDTNIIKLAMV